MYLCFVFFMWLNLPLCMGFLGALTGTLIGSHMTINETPSTLDKLPFHKCR